MAPMLGMGMAGRYNTCMHRRLGIMGGTFDPVHLGHLVTAEQARVDVGLDEVVFVPAGAPWQKDTEVTSGSTAT
jgi:cytidyltransferase-like protein